MKSLQKYVLITCGLLALAGNDATAMNFNLNPETIDELNNATVNLKTFGEHASDVLIPSVNKMFTENLPQINETLGEISKNIQEADELVTKHKEILDKWGDGINNIGLGVIGFNKNSEAFIKILSSKRKGKVFANNMKLVTTSMNDFLNEVKNTADTTGEILKEKVKEGLIEGATELKPIVGSFVDEKMEKFGTGKQLIVWGTAGACIVAVVVGGVIVAVHHLTK